MHRWVKGWLSWILVGGLILVFALWGISGLMTGGMQQVEVVEVNGEPISQHELQVTYERMAKQQQEIFAANGIDMPINQKLLKEQALKMLIDEKLLVQSVVRGGYAVSKEQLDQQLLNFPDFQVNGVFSPERFEQVAASILLSPAELKQKFYQYVLVNQMRTGVMESAFTLANEVESAIKLVEQTRDVNYLLITPEKYVKSIKPTEAELQAYYDANKETFRSTEQVSLNFIELRNTDLEKQVNITDDDVNDYYQTHLATYSSKPNYRASHIMVSLQQDPTEQQVEAAKARIAEYQQKLKQGESFADLARASSDDKFSAPQGGDLGWSSYTDTDKSDPLKATIMQLANINDVSEPVRTQYGLHLVELTGKKPAVPQPLSEVSADIRARLKAERTSELFSQTLNELSAMVFEDPTSLQAAADRFGLKVQETALFDRKGTTSGIAVYPKIVNIAFSEEVLNQHNNSEPIEVSPQNVIVIRLHEHKPATIRSFKEAEPEIVALVTEQQAAAKVKQEAADLVAQLEKGASPAQVANESAAQWRQQIGMTRRENNLPSGLTDAIFRLKHPQSADKPTIGDIELTEGNRAIVLLTGVHDGVVTNDIQKLATYADTLIEAQAYTDLMLYSKGLHDRAKIKEEKL